MFFSSKNHRASRRHTPFSPFLWCLHLLNKNSGWLVRSICFLFRKSEQGFKDGRYSNDQSMSLSGTALSPLLQEPAIGPVFCTNVQALRQVLLNPLDFSCYVCIFSEIFNNRCFGSKDWYKECMGSNPIQSFWETICKVSVVYALWHYWNQIGWKSTNLGSNIWNHWWWWLASSNCTLLSTTQLNIVMCAVASGTSCITTAIECLDSRAVDGAR